MIKANSEIPKYLQVVEYFKELIRSKKLIVGDSLPSVRQFCNDHKLSQETVIKAYTELKSLGALKSELRKGYYVASSQVDYKRNVFLLFDELSEYKNTLYNSIRKELDSKTAKIDIFFHHYNPDLFETLISNNVDSYNRFVVMPFKDEKIKFSLEKLKAKNVVFLDRNEYIDEERNNFIVQDFNESVHACLESAVDLIGQYKKIVLVFSDTDSVTSNAAEAPKEIKKGFIKFCENNSIDFEIVSKVESVHKNEAYFVIHDMDLVEVIGFGNNKGYQLGVDFGVLSYDDSPIKKVIAEGITVISTNYTLLGEKVAAYILEDKGKVQEIVPTELMIRKSL